MINNSYYPYKETYCNILSSPLHSLRPQDFYSLFIARFHLKGYRNEHIRVKHLKFIIV